MRVLLIPVMALACIAASEEAPVETPQLEFPSVSGNLAEAFKKMPKGKPAPRFQANPQALQALLGPKCRDRLERAQEEQPTLQLQSSPLFQRKPDTPENPPLAIYAVDQRENGCGMMVMMGNPEDVRPVPVFNAEDHRLMPADSDPEN